MDATATIRVTPDESGSLGKPDRSRLEAAASKLAERGFRVNRISRFGVTIEGSQDTFAKELGVNIVPDTPVVATVRPTEPELSKLIDLVEVTSPPVNFAK